MSNLSLSKRVHHAVEERSKLEILSYHVSKGIGKFFYELGFKVAENPSKTIFLSWLSVIICCAGFISFRQERDPLKLWVPENSQFLKNTHFIIKNFGEGVRIQNILITSETDVLRPEVMKTLSVINKEIVGLEAIGENGDYINYEKLCLKIPFITSFTSTGDEVDRRRKRSDFNDDFFNKVEDSESKNELKKILEPWLSIDLKKYCNIVESLPKGCMRGNFLELWKSNPERIQRLTKQEIISKLNSSEVSPETGHESHFDSLLGRIERNSSGFIISAKTILMTFVLHINFTDVDSSKLGNSAGTEDWATYNTMVFEEKYLEAMARLKKDLDTEDIKILYGAQRSYGDISSKAMFQDIDKVFFGAFLMMIYMLFVLSRYSGPEIRFLLTSVGLMNVGMAYISGCGLSSLVLFYSPVHTSLFFIILGLGVDDIFVIMSSLKKIKAESHGLSLSEKIGKTMEKAGASITITSLTDIIAFLVGGTTVLPSLKSFCIFAAVCILMTYLYAVTFFVAVLTIDEKRLAKNRNGFFPCIVHKENTLKWNPNLMHRFITFLYSKIVLTKAGKLVVILLAIAVSTFSADRVFQIKQRFDPMWFIPSSTYYFKYAMAYREAFPNRGFEAGIYMGQLNYTENLPRIINLAERIKNQSQVLSHVESWTEPFKEYVEEIHKIDITQNQLTDAQFKFYISKFLFSSMGGKYQANFKFEKTLVCGKPTSDIRISTITFRYHKFNDRDEYLPAKKLIESLVRESNITASHENIFLWGKIFGTWITDEIIDEEILRNISLALIGVFVCTAVMIVNLQVCIFIFTCVLLSLVSVGGFMQVWGLTLDLVTCISLQLSVGLCIDCAAHIGHTFLTISEGNGNERALKTLQQIGAAVWQGGGSTMLAVSMLASSEAYTYQTFFKVFTIVVIFALFYGTFLLPVILSIFAPKPYDINNSQIVRGEETELCMIQKPAEDLNGNERKKIDCDNNVNEKLTGTK